MYHRRANSNPAKDDREDEKRMLPCRYFMAGFCQKGIRCKFYHPNVHTRDPAIRVPDLSSEFNMIPQYAQYEQSHRVPSLHEMTGSRGPRSRRMKSMPGTSLGFGGSVSVSPPRGRNANGFKNSLTPSSHAYSEYLAYTQNHLEEMDEDQMDDEISEEQKNSEQHTVFSHIDWSEFLAPGVRPPPPTQVPSNEGSTVSPIRVFDFGLPGLWRPDGPERPSKSVLKIANEDMPPEGSQVAGRMDHATTLLSSPRLSASQKLSAKEELQMKVKQIAQELADEPIQHVRSLDSFFRNFKFNGFACASNPASASGIIGNEIEEIDEANKENADEAEPTTSEENNNLGPVVSKPKLETPVATEEKSSASP